MGRSAETRVRVVTLEADYRGGAELGYVQHEEYPNEVEHSAVTPKAYKALKGAQPGDIVEVVWDFDIERPVYPIVKARRITDTTEARIEALEARVEALEAALKAAGIDIPEATHD